MTNLLPPQEAYKLRDEAVTFTLYTFAINQISPVKVPEHLMTRSGTDLKMAKLLSFKLYVFRKNVKVVYDWKPPSCNMCCVFCHFSHQCGKNRVAIEKEESIKNVGMEKKKDENPKQSGNNEKSKNDGFIAVQNRRNAGFKEKNTGNPVASSEQVKNSDKVSQGQSPLKTQGKINEVGTQNDKTPQKKAWCVHGEILFAMRRSANKYSILEVYDENDLSELQEMRNRDRVEGWNSSMNEVKLGKEVDDDSGIAKCMESDGVNGIDGDVVMLGWNNEKINMSIVHCEKQFVFCEIHTVSGNNSMFCTFVYAANGGEERKELWKDLHIHKRIVDNNAWAILGDMNVTLTPNEHSTCISTMSSDMNDFKNCINSIEVEDLASSGLFFIWTKNLFKVKTGDTTGVLKKLDMIMVNEEFLDKYPQSHATFLPYLISNHSPNIIIIPKVIKPKRRAFKFANFIADKKEFIPILLSSGKLNMRDVNSLKDEEKLMHQKAKIKWLNFGGRNNVFFHKVLKSRKNKSRINAVRDSQGNQFHDHEVANQFVKHFQEFLGNVMDVKDSPEPDGFSSYFFKRAWNIVGSDVCKAIKEFFLTGKMLKEINSILIYLIPKIRTPDKVIDFRPITLGMNQSDFVPNRHIQDNILLSQEFLKGFEKKKGPKRVAMKVDIQKHMILLTGSFWKLFLKVEGRLRQGDPMSPYIFTLVIEMLTLIVHDKVDKCKEFQYHFGCKKMKLTHVCFADDLLMFCHGDKTMKIVDQEEILDYVPFKIEKMPVKYLGVPLTSKRLSAATYCLCDLFKGKAKVAWKNICKTKAVGGSSLKELEAINEDVNDSWGWKNILKMREEVRDFMVMRIGNGEKASIIYDNWCGAGILQSFITNRDMYNARRTTNMAVKDIVEDGNYMYSGNSINSIIRRLSLASLQERNCRIFRNEKELVRNFLIFSMRSSE
ncbi:RNA-directed DNA polymerase, eukaryota, reverse transcriptase zinc-binding domain protein [Tanacetum coccineum]